MIRPVLTFFVMLPVAVSADKSRAEGSNEQVTPERVIPRAKAEAVRLELERMYDSDQAHRSLAIELERKFGKESVELKDAWSTQKAIDAENISKLEAIVASEGWPGISKFGEKAAVAAFLIVQHAELSYQKKYLPLLRAAAVAGELKPGYLPLLEDRVLMREGKKQMYGSQVQRNDAGEWEPAPLQDEDHVDALRASVGLGPMAEYLQGFSTRSGAPVSEKWAKRRDEKPNKAPEPTSTSVTPRASARVAPAALVAHL